MKHILTILLATALCASCSIMCKNEFKHTSWNSVEEEFVADAGDTP